MSISELKEICSRIVGDWHCEEIGQTFIFSLNEKLLKESPVTVINKKERFNTVYGVGVKISTKMEPETRFYFDIGAFDKRYYEIISITESMLIIQEYYVTLDEYPPLPRHIYKRKPDISFSESILQGLDLN